MGDEHRLSSRSSRPSCDAERVIRTLYEITTHHALGLPGQLQRLLSLGCQRFGLDIGIVARIEGDCYHVVQAVSPDDSLGAGNEFVLGDTYCAITLEAGGPVGFAQASTDGTLRQHPCYRSFGLEAYIGVPIEVGTRIFGTLNFSSPRARERAFREVDVDALQLMGQWVSAELARRELADHVEHLVGLIPICSSCKQVRTELGDWTQLEAYLARRTSAQFTHGLCPPCVETLYADAAPADRPSRSR